MKITVEFDSEEEFEAFRVSGKKTRTKKGEAETEAPQGGNPNVPAPLQPPTNGPTMGFNPQSGNMGFTAAPAAGAAQQGAGPFAAAAPQVAPEVQALVTRVVTKFDAAVASGHDANQALAWFKSEIVKAGFAEAANATLDQVKTVWLAKLPVPVLEQIAKLMGA